MIYTYAQNDAINNMKLVWRVDRTNGVLEKLYILTPSPIKTKVIDKLVIPSSFIDSKIESTPTQVTTLGDNFLDEICDYCTDITINNLTISKGITNISGDAFNASAARMLHVSIPEGVETIHPHTFYRMTCLESVHLPETLTEIARAAFVGTSNLREVEIPDSCRAINDGAFFKSGIKSIKFGKNSEKIGANAFEGCVNLKKVAWPEKCNRVPMMCFNDCSSLESIVFSSEINFVDKLAFSGTALKTLDFSKSSHKPFVCSNSTDEGVSIIYKR